MSSSSRPQWLEAVAGDHVFEWAIHAWDKAEAVPCNWFDAALADKIVSVWPLYFRHTEGRWSGKPFVLALWQEIVVRLLVGWKNADGFRHFRRLLLWVARKNGKSEFLAALALLFWIFDEEEGGQGYCFARNEKQAKIVFNKMKTMLRKSPTLLGRDIALHKRDLFHSALSSTFEVLTGTAEGKHGLSASVIVGDEAHEIETDKMYVTLHQSTPARDQPIELIGSTAGHKNRGWGSSLYEECVAILEGRLNQPDALVAIFAVPDGCDWADEKTWSLANPNLGISPKIEYLRAECEKAKENPHLENDFRRYHLNQWTEQAVRWLPMAKWDACRRDGADWRAFREQLKGRPCYGGLDMSSTRDVTALVWLFEPAEDDQQWIIAPRFFVPKDTINERVKADKVPYDQWVHADAMEVTEGDIVDQDAVQQAILDDCALFDVKKLGYDPWNATQLALRLQDEGVPIILMRQGIPTLGEPSKQFEKYVFGRKFEHGGHPVLRWMAGNVAIKMDSLGNFRPDKEKSNEKIDGIVAAVMALGLSLHTEKKPDIGKLIETGAVVL